MHLQSEKFNWNEIHTSGTTLHSKNYERTETGEFGIFVPEQTNQR